MAMRQPSPGAPTIMSAGVRAPSKNTSQKWSPPVISTSGRTSMPGWSIGRSRKEMPLCFGPAVSVRQSAKIQSANCAWLVQTFWPSTTHSSPSRRARVETDARSLPAPGSLKPWHQYSSPRRIGGRNRARCASDPKWISVGSEESLAERAATGGSVSPGVLLGEHQLLDRGGLATAMGRGHDSPTHPPRPSSCSHATRTFQSSAENSAPVPSAVNSPTRWRSSQSRTSCRNASSSAEYPKSISAPRHPARPASLRPQLQLGQQWLAVRHSSRSGATGRPCTAPDAASAIHSGPSMAKPSTSSWAPAPGVATLSHGASELTAMPSS